jgi:hypothetical protein
MGWPGAAMEDSHGAPAVPVGAPFPKRASHRAVQGCPHGVQPSARGMTECAEGGRWRCGTAPGRPRPGCPPAAALPSVKLCLQKSRTPFLSFLPLCFLNIWFVTSIPEYLLNYYPILYIRKVTDK